MANRRMKRIGTVVRDANDKTIVVAYAWSQRHRIYKRSRRRITKFVAHDELNEASIGDRVEIEECRPYSATKRWRLNRVLAKVDVVTGTEAPDVVSEADVPADEPEVADEVSPVMDQPTDEVAGEPDVVESPEVASEVNAEPEGAADQTTAEAQTVAEEKSAPADETTPDATSTEGRPQ